MNAEPNWGGQKVMRSIPEAGVAPEVNLMNRLHASYKAYMGSTLALTPSQEVPKQGNQ